MPSAGFAAGLLGAGVASGAQHRAGRLGPRRLGQRAGEPEVADAQPSLLAEQEVGGLDVAVHEAARVRVLEAAGGLEPDHQRLRRREPGAGVEHGAQAAAAEVLGDEVGLALVVAPVVDREHVRVVQGRGRLRFGAEPAEKGLILGQRLVQQLGGHAPP